MYRKTDIIPMEKIMTIEGLLSEKGYTVYGLSKKTGISKTTLFDIFSGKSDIMDCRLRVILKIADALGCEIKDIVCLDPIPYNPVFEEDIPEFLKESLAFIKDKRNMKKPLYDCYADEANSSINVCEIENLISKEQADYLRNKYLR